MAQINTPKAFDNQQLDSKFVKEAGPLIDYMNQNFDQISRALIKQLSLGDNFRGRLLQVSALHNQRVDIQGDGTTGIIVLSGGVKSLEYAANTTGQVGITFKFSMPIAIKVRSVTVASSIATYEVQPACSAAPGDMVSITGYGNKSNNGDFMVLARTTTSVVVYNASGATETKTDYSGAQEPQKTVNIFVFN